MLESSLRGGSHRGAVEAEPLVYSHHTPVFAGHKRRRAQLRRIRVFVFLTGGERLKTDRRDKFGYEELVRKKRFKRGGGGVNGTAREWRGNAGQPVGSMVSVMSDIVKVDGVGGLFRGGAARVCSHHHIAHDS